MLSLFLSPGAFRICQVAYASPRGLVPWDWHMFTFTPFPPPQMHETTLPAPPPCRTWDATLEKGFLDSLSQYCCEGIRENP